MGSEKRIEKNNRQLTTDYQLPTTDYRPPTTIYVVHDLFRTGVVDFLLITICRRFCFSV